MNLGSDMTGTCLTGRVLRAVVGKRAEIVSGLILTGVGSVILYEHLHAG